jgi:hypothetical protein
MLHNYPLFSEGFVENVGFKKNTTKCFPILPFYTTQIVWFSAGLGNLMLKNIILLNINDLFSIANLSCPSMPFMKKSVKLSVK